MASRRNLKKKITNIASDLFLVSLMEGVNRESSLQLCTQCDQTDYTHQSH